jgi:hypothetical protein
MVCPNVPVAGTPAQQQFIVKANVVIALGRELHMATNSTTASGIVQEMSVALEAAANAYEALGLSDELTQTQWDDFKLDCVDGVAPTLEENYLIACGLTAVQRAALNQDQSAQRSVLDHRIKYKPGTVLHQASALLNTNNVGFADLLHQPIGDCTVSAPANGDGVQLQWGSAAGGLGGLGGVNITLPGVVSWDGYWSDLDPNDMLPVGAFVESSATGDAFGAITNGPLGSWRIRKINHDTHPRYAVTADFSPVGASNVTVLVFNGTNLVASVPGLSGDLCTVNGCVSDDHWGRPLTKPGFGGSLTFRDPREIRFPNSTAFVVGDRISILPESSPPITSLTSITITASGVPSLTITNESVSASSVRPLIRWITIGVPGVFGGCFPGFGICSFNPTRFPDSTAVMLTEDHGLKLEFLSDQSSAATVFSVTQPVELDVEAAHDFGFAKFRILPGQYPVDFSQNPFGTVHLDTAAEDLALVPTTGDQYEINWANDGVRVLQETSDVGGVWTDVPVQVTTPTGGYRRPPQRFFRVRRDPPF